MRTSGWILLTVLVLTMGVALGQNEANHSEHHGAGAQAQQSAGMIMPQLESELDFLRHMILHHQEAVESAREIEGVTERDEVRRLAQEIVAVQTQEIETLRGWLEQWHPGETLEVAYQPMMRSLEGLSPDEADRVFIEDMIEHHRMAVMNAQQLLTRGLAEHDEVAAMAQDIVEVQMGEIAELESWLRDWFGEGAGQGAAGMAGMGMTNPGETPGMVGQGMTPPDMMGMDRMMQHCMTMMGMMGQDSVQGMMAPGMGAMPGMMGGARSSRYDQGAVEALARAFLAGYSPQAEITDVELPQTLYRVAFRDGDATGVLVVDADTGEVGLEPQGD